MRKLLLQFLDCGLGDAMQFQIVLKHLKHYYPDTQIGVETNQGQHPCFAGLADEVFNLVHPFYWREHYPKPKTIIFQRPGCFYSGIPSTKPTRCLAEEFYFTTRAQPLIESFYHYTFEIPPEAHAQAERYHLEELDGQPFSLLHYEGVSGREDKDLDQEDAEWLCRAIYENGTRPVLLDWHRRSSLPSKGIACPGNTHWLWDTPRAPNVANLAALISRATAFYGIDSGPEHLAGALGVPTFIYWTGNHPALCYDLADNVTHLLPRSAKYELEPEHLEYFERHYRHEYYTCKVGAKNYRQQD